MDVEASENGLEGELIPRKRIVLSDALSPEARIAVYAHELRHAEQHRRGVMSLLENTPPLDSMFGLRAVEADAEAISHLVCWELRGSAPGAWRYLAGHSSNHDIATAFAAAATSGRGRLADATRAAFHRFLAVAPRVHAYDEVHADNWGTLTKRIANREARLPGTGLLDGIGFAIRAMRGAREVAGRKLQDRGRLVPAALRRLHAGTAPYLTAPAITQAVEAQPLGLAKYKLYAIEMAAYGHPVSRVRVDDPRPAADALMTAISAAASQAAPIVRPINPALARRLDEIVRKHAAGATLSGLAAGAAWAAFEAAATAAREATHPGYWVNSRDEPLRVALTTAADAAWAGGCELAAAAAYAPTATF